MSKDKRTEKYADFEIDDIFNRLKETQEKEGVDNVSDNNDSKGLTYNELKKKVSNLPSIELHLFSNKEKKNNRKIVKVNESIESVLPTNNNKNFKIIRDRRLQREENSNKWFEMPKVELTDDIKRDLLIIKNRKYLDPKRFYRGEKWEIPENFQIGEIVEGVGEYGGKIKRKQKGKSIVDELLKDENSSTWFDKTYTEIQSRKKSGGKKFLKDKIAKRKKY